MRRWKIIEPGGQYHSDVEMIFTDQQILEMYSDYWQDQMQRVGKEPHEYSIEDCIQDWVVINWAEEVKD